MSNNLFGESAVDESFFEISYQGPSFDGRMEITNLELELNGLSTSLKLLIDELSLHKRIDFKSSDIKIFIEAFEKGSFKKRVRIFRKTMEDNPVTTGAIVAVLVGLMALVPQLKSEKIKEMSPELILEIRDDVKISLLSDPKFRQAIADVVIPLASKDDALVLTNSNQTSTTIYEKDKIEFLKLADKNIESLDLIENFATYDGKVTKVDLDATKNHIGFKIENKGSTIDCTLKNKLSQDELKNLLGQWVRITGITTELSGEKTHIDISTYELIDNITSEPLPFYPESI